MPKGNKPAARAIEWLCLIIGHLTLRNFKSMPESPFQIWSQWAENLTNCELLNEKPRLDGHPDGARGRLMALSRERHAFLRVVI